MAVGEDRPLASLSPFPAAQVAARAADPARRQGPPPPDPALARELAAVWQEVLGVPAVSREDSFFELGGHSLLAGRLLARVEAAFGVEIPLSAFLDDPTLGGMAAAITAALLAQADEPDLDALIDQLAEMDEEEAERLLGEVRT
jgi:acyl carrier protein